MKMFNKINKIKKTEIEKLALIETIATSIDNVIYLEQLFYVTVAMKMTDISLSFFEDENGVKFSDAYQYLIDNNLDKKLIKCVGKKEFYKMLELTYKRYQDNKSMIPSQEEISKMTEYLHMVGDVNGSKEDK